MEASLVASHDAFTGFHLLMLECLCGQPYIREVNLGQLSPVRHNSPYRNDVTISSPWTNSWTVIRVDKIYRKRKRRKRRCTMTVAMEEREGSSKPIKNDSQPTSTTFFSDALFVFLFALHE
jgi:hypothetical protein